MTALFDYLLGIEGVTEVRDIVVTIKGTKYMGCSYKDTHHGDRTRYYLLGELPACYRRSSRTAFVIDGQDWYVACYMQGVRVTPENTKYHPGGANFLLCEWKVPDGTSIDRYELRPYNRVPAAVKTGN